MGQRIDPARDALVVVDVQNDFCPGGALGVSGGDAVVGPLNDCAARFAAVGAPVFVTRDWHPERTTHFKAYGGVWPPHCVQGTPGAAFHRDLRLPAGVQVFSKGMDPVEDAYSCFQARTESGEGFGAVLRRCGIRRLFIGGLATDYCVRTTALDALAAGLEAIVLEDAVRAVDLQPGDGERALQEMKRAGARSMRSDEL